MLFSSDIKLVKTEVGSLESAMGRSKKKRWEVSVNDSIICYLEEGSEMYCSIKNGSPSNIRNVRKPAYYTKWQWKGLKEIFSTSNFKDHFKDRYPDTTWGNTGTILTQAAIKQTLLEYWFLENTFKLSNIIDEDIKDLFYKHTLLFNKYSSFSDSLEALRPNDKEFLNYLLNNFSISRLFLDYTEEQANDIQDLINTPNGIEIIINSIIK